MQVHRTKPSRRFTVVPNEVIRDPRLSYTARGLLVDLLSRPDGWREDGRQMADRSPQGRGAVAKALRELRALGYYRVERVRQPDGRIFTDTHVYDVPFAWKAEEAAKPGTGTPDSGETSVENPAGKPIKTWEEKPPPLPAPRKPPRERRAKRGAGGWRKRPAAPPAEPAEPAASAEPHDPAAPAEPETEPQVQAEPPDEVTIQAAALLHGVTSREPRLRLGAVEALALAPLVKPWLEQGLGPHELAPALLSDLPERVYSASAFLRGRLVRKLPPPPSSPLSSPLSSPPPAPPRFPGLPGPLGAAPQQPPGWSPQQPPGVTPPEPPAAPPGPRWHECTACARPTPDAGICRICAGLDAPPPGVVDSQSQITLRGVALARAAMRSRNPLPAPGT